MMSPEMCCQSRPFSKVHTELLGLVPGPLDSYLLVLFHQNLPFCYIPFRALFETNQNKIKWNDGKVPYGANSSASPVHIDLLKLTLC